MIQELDSSSKEIVNEIKSDDESIYTYSKSELNNKSKTELTFESKEKESFNFKYKIYQKNKFIFASSSYVQEPLFWKGGSDTVRPKFKLEESKMYFKNNSVGIQYSRFIYVFENQNMDSLKTDLNQKTWTNKRLNNSDYLSVLKRVERFQEK